ncbi:amidase [Saccharothrix longispora]|uniref:Asp-tRNA(Asn)/Glu-tRNA(Gln) amidotransferase A subunit family amidase n=1 Tax=Saccharothrix longispora TaxID=33920 RepID=A0ABU1PSW5_9PSEU|nr:amidase family protein [Saccharothrix longispora]MDR6593748.1 Asp-tRNA(Asn)/Glu-tRNA(Gln) amidotransferase A subunit family amidase [Saccharothrix longispora]
MDEHDYLRHDGLALGGLVAAGEVTPAELLALARARAKAVNPTVNAICAWLDDHADQRVGEELSGPFAGVPFLLKDLHQDLAGTPTSNGSRALAGVVATSTSTVVRRWLDAGVVVFGKTSTPEFGSKGVTEPALFGPARNPWDPSRTPGGSSGGSAAAVAAGVVPVAGASDGGGSIRIPAACTGLVGLKPGRGLVPFGPDESEPLSGLATHGVVSRTVRDTAAMLDVLVGADAMSPFAPGVPAGSLLAGLGEGPGRLRVGFTTRCALRGTPHPEAVRAVERAAELLVGLGHEVEEVAPPHDDRRLGRDFLTIWFVHQAVEVARIKRAYGVGDGAFEPDTVLMAALGRSFGAVELEAAQERRREHIAALAGFHERYDLLMTPTLGEPPVRVGALDTPAVLRAVAGGLVRVGASRLLRLGGAVDQVVERNLAWVPYTQLANVTGRPAISLPLHRTVEGLPMGVQFVGRLSAEGVLLRLARQLEEAAPWELPVVGGSHGAVVGQRPT